MKNLKTYKEFDIVTESGTLIGIGIYGIGVLLAKIGSKLLLDKKNKHRIREMMGEEEGLYTDRRWEIEENNDIISLTPIRYASSKSGPDYIIDKKNRTFEHKSDTYPLKVKLNEVEFKELLDGIYFTKEITESIDDCFYELKDGGYKVTLGRIDFSKKSFSIEIESTIRSNPYDDSSWEVDGEGEILFMNQGDENISLDKLAPILDDCLYRIISQYDVKIDQGYNNRYKKLQFIEKLHDEVVYDYKDGIIILSNGELYNINKDTKGNKDYYIKNNINTLTVPFIKK